LGYILGDFFTNPSGQPAWHCQSGLTDFSWCMIPKPEKMYQMNTKYTEWSQNIPNIHKVFQMAIQYINNFQSEALKFFSQIRIFGLKTNHLATLLSMRKFRPH
jgi:hypothetical protein